MKQSYTAKKDNVHSEHLTARKPLSESSAMLAGIYGSEFSSKTSNIVNKLRDDEISRACKEDKLILTFGVMLYEVHSTPQQS